MLWILLAAQLSGLSSSHPTDVRGLFSYNDFPAYLSHIGDLSRTVYTRTTIRDDGTLQDCSVELSSGDPKLDAYTCALIVKRGKFLAGRAGDGTALYTVLRFPVNWTITSSFPSREERWRAIIPDLELSVDRLPKGAKKLVDLTLENEVDDKGRIVACGELPPLRADQHQHFSELAPIACQNAVKTLSLRPPRDRNGAPTRSIQTTTVRFAIKR
jgi:hypothetical protein